MSDRIESVVRLISRLSVILPAYNEEEALSKTACTVSRILERARIPYELIFVDDGSLDNTWIEIEKLCETDAHIIGVHFSRNFGKEAAVYAGLAQSTGSAAAVMDCDLQHPPEVLPDMYRLWQQGYEVIEGVKSSRGQENLLHRHGAGLFYRIMTKATGVDMQNTSDFKLLDRKAVDAILSMPERSLFFRAASAWVGFRSTTVSFQVQERVAGKSKWSPWSLTKYAFTNIVSFTTMPLQFVSFAGAACFVLSLLLLLYSLIQYFSGHAVEGYTTILTVLLFIGSAIMMSLGIIGYYIARIYEEVKHRPRYLISKIAGVQRTSWESESRDGKDNEKK